MDEPENLLPKHGGFRRLKTFQLAEVIYDVTVRFCDQYIPRTSRTRDQMVQAARSGKQNIAEGSEFSATSKKLELKLTNTARASLRELLLDYEDFLRGRELEQWPPHHPALKRFKNKRCSTLQQVREWVRDERALALKDRHGLTRTVQSGASVSVRVSPCAPPRARAVPSSAQLVANATLSLLNLCLYLLDRQLRAQASAFEQEGGFTERLYRVRQARRNRR